jgi:hypothetical protein
LRALDKILSLNDLALAARARFGQNLGFKELTSKIFEINELDMSSSVPSEFGARFLCGASMTLLFSFHVLGQGYPSQRKNKVVEKTGASASVAPYRHG